MVIKIHPFTLLVVTVFAVLVGAEDSSGQAVDSIRVGTMLKESDRTSLVEFHSATCESNDGRETLRCQFHVAAIVSSGTGSCSVVTGGYPRTFRKTSINSWVSDSVPPDDDPATRDVCGVTDVLTLENQGVPRLWQMTRAKSLPTVHTPFCERLAATPVERFTVWNAEKELPDCGGRFRPARE